MYRLDNTLIQDPPHVLVVGCGGTGGFVAEGLARILPREARLTLVDLDRVEERNLLRQNFTASDLGKFKSEALAVRLSREMDRPIAYSTLPIAAIDMVQYRHWGSGLFRVERVDIVVGCVDNGLARRDIADGFRGHTEMFTPWWVDAGNGENFGQILIGNADDKPAGLFDEWSHRCRQLPLPTVQRPDILQQAPQTPNCAEAVAAGDQGPTINQVMAALVLEVVRRLLEGTCPWMQLYVDMDEGTMTPVLATPETVAKIIGCKVKELISSRKGAEDPP